MIICRYYNCNNPVLNGGIACAKHALPIKTTTMEKTVKYTPIVCETPKNGDYVHIATIAGMKRCIYVGNDPKMYGQVVLVNENDKYISVPSYTLCKEVVPIEIWVNYYPNDKDDRYGGVYLTRENALHHADDNINSRQIKFIEVIE